jgi:hypothetical protein
MAGRASPVVVWIGPVRRGWLGKARDGLRWHGKVGFGLAWQASPGEVR